jgi:hypothetical protein
VTSRLFTREDGTARRVICSPDRHWRTVQQRCNPDPTQAKAGRPDAASGVASAAARLHKCRRATIYDGTVPKGSPSEAVTISSPERRMYAHFLGRDRLCLFRKSGAEGPRPRTTRNSRSGQAIERKIRDQTQDVW